MKTKLYILGAFALGVGCGSVAAYFYVYERIQNKFDMELEKETELLKDWADREVERRIERELSEPFCPKEDEVSQVLGEEEWPEGLDNDEFDKRSNTIKHKATVKERTNYAAISSVYAKQKPDLEELAEKIRARGEHPSEDDEEEIDPSYTECYQTMNDTPPEPHTCEGDWIHEGDGVITIVDRCLECPYYEKEGAEDSEEPFVTPPIKTGILYERGEAPKIEVISEEEFFDPTKTYDSEQLTYYKQDDTLADADDEVVDIEKTIGGDSLEKFEDGTVYVRNHEKETDYEVQEEDKSYQHYVLGVDDENGGFRRRFADKEEE